MSYALEVDQPEANLVASGKIWHLNLWKAPPRDLLGKRVLIWSQKLAAPDLWMIPEYRGLAIEPSDWKERGFQFGLVASVVVRGALKYDWTRRVVLGQMAPEGVKLPKPKRGLLGPYAWILGEPRAMVGEKPGGETRMLVARYEDLPEVKEREKRYYERWGYPG